jgi:hypothetical protein
LLYDATVWSTSLVCTEIFFPQKLYYVSLILFFFFFLLSSFFFPPLSSSFFFRFISEADKNEPGTDKDIDYYTCKKGTVLPPIMGTFQILLSDFFFFKYPQLLFSFLFELTPRMGFMRQNSKTWTDCNEARIKR